MSSNRKRTLNDVTNEKKRRKNDSAIDLSFDMEESKMKTSYSTSTSSESLVDDDDNDVFEDEQNRTDSLSKISQSQGRKRLNATSTHRNKRKSKYVKKDTNIPVDQITLNQLREEQARIDAHSLSILAKKT